MLPNRFFGYKYTLSDSAIRDFKKLDKKISDKIKAKLDELVSRKERLDVKSIVGSSQAEYRLRVGEYRVIFLDKKKEILIVVVAVGHRREVYK